jgi:hypothetical protein
MCLSWGRDAKWNRRVVAPTLAGFRFCSPFLSSFRPFHHPLKRGANMNCLFGAHRALVLIAVLRVTAYMAGMRRDAHRNWKFSHTSFAYVGVT